MEDPRLSCAQVIYRYAELIDAGDFDGVADHLAEAELTFEGQDLICRGREAISQLYTATTRRYPDGTPKTKHIINNLVVELELDPSHARARSYFVVFQSVPGQLTLQPVVAGRYQHRLQDRNGMWRIVGMHINVELTGELGHHLLIKLD